MKKSILKIAGMLTLAVALMGASSCDEQIDIVGTWDAKCTDFGGKPVKPGYTWRWTFKAQDPQAPAATEFILEETDPQGFVQEFNSTYVLQPGMTIITSPFGGDGWLYYTKKEANGNINMNDGKTICILSK